MNRSAEAPIQWARTSAWGGFVPAPAQPTAVEREMDSIKKAGPALVSAAIASGMISVRPNSPEEQAFIAKKTGMRSGLPRGNKMKADDVGTPKQIQARLYMRRFRSQRKLSRGTKKTATAGMTDPAATSPNTSLPTAHRTSAVHGMGSKL